MLRFSENWHRRQVVVGFSFWSNNFLAAWSREAALALGVLNFPICEVG